MTHAALLFLYETEQMRGEERKGSQDKRHFLCVPVSVHYFSPAFLNESDGQRKVVLQQVKQLCRKSMSMRS